MTIVGRVPRWLRHWWIVLAVVVLVALGVGTGLSLNVASTAAPLMEETKQIADADKRVAAQKDLLQYQADNQAKIWTTLAQAALAVAASIGAYFTWRNLRVTQERLDVDRQAQITNRFTQAIGQLGAELKSGEPNLEVRLGGIYALERIARDSPRDHWTIMEILTAYVRQNARWTDPIPPNDAVTSSEEPREEPHKAQKPERERVRTDIQAILTVLGRRTSSEDRELLKLDLRETDLLRAFLGRANLQQAQIGGARLMLANLEDAHLEHANLAGTNLQWARLGRAHLEGAILWFANLYAADLEEAHLKDANLTGANLKGAFLNRAYLEAAELGFAQLGGAHLAEADLSTAKNLTEEQVKSVASRTGARLPPASCLS